jgi:hypothetical protein
VLGIHRVARGAGKDGPTVAVNTRCLDGVEVEKLKLQQFDGRSR